jgi:hypothetical protein
MPYKASRSGRPASAIELAFAGRALAPKEAVAVKANASYTGAAKIRQLAGEFWEEPTACAGTIDERKLTVASACVRPLPSSLQLSLG